MEREGGVENTKVVLTGPRDAPSASAFLSNRIGFTAAAWRTHLHHRSTTLQPSAANHHNSHYPLAVTELSRDPLPPTLSRPGSGQILLAPYLHGAWPLWRGHVKIAAPATCRRAISVLRRGSDESRLARSADRAMPRYVWGSFSVGMSRAVWYSWVSALYRELNSIGIRFARRNKLQDCSGAWG